MQIHYLEIVTRKVDAVCAAYAAAHGVQFGEPDAGLGHARTAALPGGGLVGARSRSTSWAASTTASGSGDDRAINLVIGGTAEQSPGQPRALLDRRRPRTTARAVGAVRVTA